MAKRCPGCMKEKTQSPVCEHCGYNENIPNYAHQLPIGMVLRGQYIVGKVLGQGGFGITYIGWDESLESPVAIKEFYPNSFVTRDSAASSLINCISRNAEALYTDNRERFLREARVLAKLQNVPGIVRVQNLFSENNTAYIVMEYVEGIDLKNYIRSRNRLLTVEEAFSVLRPVMYALSKVHDAELVHRDISPDNIMIQTDGTAKLLDFGAAREVENAEVDKDLPQSTEAILKHGFAPMEQYRRRGSLGPWTDVYALCATLYYCLTGKVPNSAPERIMGDDNVNWRQIPGLSEQQIATLEKGLALMPEDRIRTMRELHNGLFGQSTTGYTQVKKEEPKPEPKKKQEKKQASYPAHTVSLESDESAPAVMETKKKKKTPIGLIAAVLAVVVAVGVFGMKQKEVPDDDFAVELRETEFAEVPANNILNNDWFQLAPYALEKHLIDSITFYSTLDDAPDNVWDVSADKSGTVLAWHQINENSGIDLFIGAENGIYAPVDCTHLFSGYTYLENIYFNNALHTENVTNMDEMFSSCFKLTELDLSSFDTSNVTDMNSMFFNCPKLNELDISSFQTFNVTNMNGMFRNCKSLKEFDVSAFDTSSVTDMRYMFYNCTSISDLDISNWDVSNVVNYHSFADDNATVNGQSWEEFFLIREPGVPANNVFYKHWFYAIESKVRKDQISSIVFLDTLAGMPADALDVSEPKNKSVMAWLSGAGNNITVYIAGEGGIYAPADCGNLFWQFENLTSIRFNDAFHTDHVIDMTWMFKECSKLKTLDLTNFKTSKVSNMRALFSGCNELVSLNLSDFDTSSVIDMVGMFSGCGKLTELDINGFNTSKVTDMSGMFYGCTSLNFLDIAGFDTSKVTDMSSMFLGCTSLASLDVTDWDVSNVDDYMWFMDEGRTINDRPWEEFFE